MDAGLGQLLPFDWKHADSFLETQVRGIAENRIGSFFSRFLRRHLETRGSKVFHPCPPFISNYLI